MNWKFRLLLAGLVILAAAVLIKLPSQADTTADKASGGNNAPVKHGKVTQYPNGITSVEADAVALSIPVRDMPIADRNSLAKRATFVDPEKLREMQAENARRKVNGEATEDEDEAQRSEKEINELNAEEVKTFIPGAGAGEHFIDPLMDKALRSDAPQAMPTPDLTFDGNTQADNASQGIGALLPPDVIGDVGPNHYVHAVNLVFSVYNKSGTRVAGPAKMSSIYSTLPAGSPCRRDDGDPTVAYDQLADRWVLTEFALPTGLTAPTYQCLAVSQTPDPTGAYYVYQFLYPNNVVNDYPKFGVWRDGYYMTTNEFNSGGAGFAGAGMLAFDRDKMLQGDRTATLQIRRVSTSGGVLPTDIDGYGGPPTDLDHVFMEFRSDEGGDPFDGLRAFRFRPDFTNPANTIFQVINDIPLAPFDPRNPSGRLDIEQLGGANLESLSGRLMHRMGYRNLGTQDAPVNAYTGSFTVNTSGLNPTTPATYDASVRWFELRRTANETFSVFDQGTQADTSSAAPGLRLNNWMASISLDNRGDLALGYSQSGPNQNADIKIAGRTNNVANSGVLNEGEALFYDAMGSQTSTSGRWGDYSAMTLDSADDCTFWFTQEYYATTSAAGWSTRIGKFKFPQCTPAPKATITGTVTFCATGAPISGAFVDSTGGFVRTTSANGTYTMTVAPGTYTVTASKTGGFTSAAQTVTVTAGQTATVNICLTGFAVVASGTVGIVSESCGLPNGAPDPGETLTVSLPLQNTGAASTNNLTATLQATGGVTNPTAATQSYGALAPGSVAATRNFTFTVNPNLPCGSTVTLTFDITDGATNYGTVTKTFTTGVRTASLTENFDGVTAPALPAGWTSVQTSGTGINWTTVSTAPVVSAPNVAFANDPATTNAAALVSPPTLISGTDAQISFKNFYNTESSWDGMVLEYTTNGGTTWTDVITGGGSFVSGGYNITLNASLNPLAGRMAWSGNSGAFIDTVVNLPASLNGQTVQFRWVMGSDASVGGAGVRIDDVQVLGARVCNTCGPGACMIQRRNDYTGDGKTDFAVFRPSTNTWYIQPNGAGSAYGVTFGASGDKLQPTDYDGDGKTDIAVFRGGVWYWIRSSDNALRGYQFGAAGDVPVASDYTGDGKAELAVYRPSTGVWYTFDTTTSAVTAVQWGGNPTDVPAVGDFDGDCKTDYVVRRTTGETAIGSTHFFILLSSGGATSVRWGRDDMQMAIGDYDGDSKSDIGVVDTQNGQFKWYVIGLTNNVVVNGIQFGQTGDVVTTGDYNGDARADLAVFRPSNGTFYYRNSINGTQATFIFGASGDVPTARANQYPLP